jgi:multiple sugar transport system substrate-binding protein
VVAACGPTASPAPGGTPPAGESPAVSPPGESPPTGESPPAASPPAASPPAETPPTGESPPVQSPGAGQEQGVDDGTQLTMWTRAATEERATALVNAYNESHDNEIELRVVPTDEYVGVVGRAATANQLPDLFSADVVFMPNWTSAGLFTDLTDRIDALPYIDNVGPAHINASTWEGKKYGLPFIIDLSVWMYNKALFRDAGLDPESPPQNLDEFAAAARAVQGLNREGVYGTFWGGACGGCNVFTWWPISWAEGDPIMNEDGTESLNNSDTMKTIYRTFSELWDEGVIHPESQQEAGPTWTGYFPQGIIGIMPMPASLQEIAGEGIADEDIGVTPIKGITGGESTFVGGDSIGVSKDSQNVDQAWNFISWMLGDEAQVEVVAQGGNVVARPDLANNQYAAQDPRLVIFNEIAGQGETPLARNFFAAYNDPQSPWIQLFQAAVFQDASDEQIDQLNDQITQVLQAQ